ncbi:hypothetical protein A6770_14665 [Nostoc minutum NIES-26]|uniref:Uncharacterized protein n=1 Tax=Nostoc minutum NIES-26 TaxID=1844469 RepID=A0A367RNX4_9NOSO|nr:hypothetical protein A6770_14665 [Nostoc minutum NIES-26]
MENINFIPEAYGETTDVESWLSRAGLRFADLGNDAASRAIRRQWREYQAAVQRGCAVLHQPPERIQLSGVYAHLRIPVGAATQSRIGNEILPSHITGQKPEN